MIVVTAISGGVRQQATSEGAATLQGTKWQLVKFQGGDERTLELGPLALTRAKCPEGSLHDHIAKQWTFVRSFVIKDGHLFLALMADGGIYEFAPLASAR